MLVRDARQILDKRYFPKEPADNADGKCGPQWEGEIVAILPICHQGTKTAEKLRKFGDLAAFGLIRVHLPVMFFDPVGCDVPAAVAASGRTVIARIAVKRAAVEELCQPVLLFLGQVTGLAR